MNKIKNACEIFKKRTRLDILIKSYIIMIIMFGIMSIILNSFYPIIFSLSVFSILIIIAGVSVFIEICEELDKKEK